MLKVCGREVLEFIYGIWNLEFHMLERIHVGNTTITFMKLDNSTACTSCMKTGQQTLMGSRNKKLCLQQHEGVGQVGTMETWLVN